ncbi:MAG: VWA domain-containing protein [Pseudomonadales bacterium]|nr:VWA domain-containing protein [Pseudomonadales bacterium]
MTHFQVVVISIAMFVASLLVGVPVMAADPKPDMRLVIDISGSMKKTDPDNLRIPASKLLLNLAKDQSQFGVWTFGQYVNMLVPHKPVDGPWRENALNRVELINSVALYTNIGEALEKASLNQTEPDPEWDRTIVLLSDGKVDISKDPAKNEREKQRILNEVIPKLKKAGFKIHSVALSTAADTEFLKQIAVETKGRYSLANSADDLMALFVQASDQVNKPEQIPLEGNVFNIDAAVQEFTALIFRKPGSTATELYSPSKRKITVRKKPKNVNWFNDSRYDLITVKNPEAGRWRVKADMSPDNRVTVVTDLSLVVDGLPDNLIEGEKITMSMHLDEKGRVVTNRDFLSILDITFSQNTSSGDRFAGKLSHDKSGKAKLPQDGIYSAKLGRTLTEGEHLFEVFVDGKSFQRKRTQRVTVHRDVLNVESNFGEKDGEEFKFLIVKPKAALVDPEQINIVAQLKGPAGEKALQNAQINDEGMWQIDAPMFDGPGVYEVLIKVSGVSASGRPFELIQGPYEVDYTAVGLSEEPLPDLEEMAVAFEEEDLEVPEIEEPEPEEEKPELLIDQVQEEVEVPEPQEPPEEVVTEATEEDGMDMMLLMAIVVVGNIVLIGGGWFVYRKMTNKEDEERETVEEEITRMHRERTATQTVPKPARADIEGDDPFDAEEATVINTTADTAGDEATVAQPMSRAAPEPIPEEENQAYENKAAPLEIEEDDLIEVDDFDEFDEDGIGDLDDMLSEQESSEEDDPGFAKDEFMLDNPDDK